ncbi:GA-like domain-containing protein, partial [Enterococcus faecalis]|uniref:GA-like domain-containing protein n=1 Tax=Enterococcus faecalis TaxID=1351 RepID=UPI0022E303EC
GNLIGTPLINDWIDGENSREVKIPVTISNGDEKVMVEVPLTILHDTRAADAVKAAEDAGKAGADKKAEVETDGLVTPEEKAAVDGLSDTTTAKKEDASKLVDALPEGPVKDSLKDRLDKVTTSEVTVNDADSNGKADDVDLAEKAAADAVKAAEDAGKAGADKKAEVETDGLVTPEEKAAVDGLLEIKQSSFMPFENLFSTTNDYSQFPKTGEKSDSILTIYGGLLLLSSIGLLGIKKRKNNTN